MNFSLLIILVLVDILKQAEPHLISLMGEVLVAANLVDVLLENIGTFKEKHHVRTWGMLDFIVLEELSTIKLQF